MEVYTPVKLEELTEKLSKEKKVFHFLAGGTDLFSSINRGILHPEALINLNSLKSSLDFINISTEHIEIGALTTLQKIIDYAQFKQNAKLIPDSMYKALSSIGSVQIRNLATLAGNIANASPAADSIPSLLVEDGKINLLSTEGFRKIEVEKFYHGYKKTEIRPDEIIYSIEFNTAGDKEFSNFIKIGTRSAMTISKLNLAYKICADEIKLAAGSVSPFPMRLKTVEDCWFKVPPLTIEKIQEILTQEISPIDDIRSTANYRIKVLANIIFQIYSNNHFCFPDEVL